MNKLIGDLTRPQFQSAERLIGTLKAYATGDHDVSFLCLDSQTAAFETQGVPLEVLPSGSHFTDIARSVWRKYVEPFIKTAAETEEKLLVVTNHKAVFDLHREVPLEYQNRILFSSWSRIYHSLSDEAKRGLESPAGTRPAGEQFMPEDELLPIVRDALSRAGAVTSDSAIWQTSLRKFLVDRDPRFNKDNPRANAPGLITDVVRIAAEHGLVRINMMVADRSNPRIWLAPTAPEKAVAAVQAKQPQIVEKTVSRSQTLVNLLTAKGLGPFSKVRPLLLQTIGAVGAEVENGKDLTLSQVLTEVIARTKRDAVDGKVVESTYPWRHLRSFLMTLLSRRPVLKSDKGQPIAARFQNLSTKVSGLTPNWELDLEGELIVALVEASADLYLNDLNQLAGALYLNRANEIETKVGEIISFLLNTSRLVEGDDHSLQLPKNDIIDINAATA